MDPLFEIVSAEKFENYLKYKKGVKVSNPLEQAYIKVEEEYFVFGELAKDFHAEEGLLEIKYEKAMYKVMVAIGIILEKNKIKTNKNIPTEIGVLLPWNEYNARKIFTDVLQTLLKRYHFRGKIVKIKSDKNSITVRPEGSGIYSFLLREKSSKFFQDKRIGIAVFGYRNLTGFFLDDGEVEKGVTSHLGVSTLVDDIMRMTSGLEREKIVKALPLAIKEASIDKYSWDKILNSEGSEIINGEKEREHPILETIKKK